MRIIIHTNVPQNSQFDQLVGFSCEIRYSIYVEDCKVVVTFILSSCRQLSANLTPMLTCKIIFRIHNIYMQYRGGTKYMYIHTAILAECNICISDLSKNSPCNFNCIFTILGAGKTKYIYSTAHMYGTIAM